MSGNGYLKLGEKLCRRRKKPKKKERQMIAAPFIWC
jgi:hypothetical protein